MLSQKSARFQPVPQEFELRRRLAGEARGNLSPGRLAQQSVWHDRRAVVVVVNEASGSDDPGLR